LEYQKINIDSIDIKSPCWDRFIIAFQSEIKDITESIKKYGLINPIKVWKKAGDDGYWLLAGFNRLKAIIRLKWQEIPAMAYQDDELNEIKALELALVEVFYGRQLSDAEKAFFLEKVCRCFSLNHNHIAAKCSHYLKLAPSETLMNHYIKKGKLSKKYLSALHKGTLSIEQAQAVFDFKKDERKVLLNLLCHNIYLNRNESLQFFQLIKDLTIINRCSAKDLLSKSVLSSIYTNNKLHQKKKGEKLLELLRKMRYPKMHQTIDEFQQNIINANLPDRVHIQHPPYFEGDRLRFVIDSHDENELAYQLDTIKKSLSTGKMKPLFKYI
jgi:ParB/RepB/Spo0J family partition protein